MLHGVRAQKVAHGYGRRSLQRTEREQEHMSADPMSGRFRKGQSGNPKGRPKGARNKATIEVQAAAAELVDDPIYRAKLARDLRTRKVAPPIEAMLWYYAKGKPKEIIEHQGDLTLAGVPDADVRARIAELLAKL